MTVRQRSGGRSDRRSGQQTPRPVQVLRENLGELRERAGEQASALSQGLKIRGQNLIEEQKIRAATEIANLGAAVRRAADKLHDQRSDRLAKYVDTAAKQLDGMARYVVENDLGDLVQEAERFARRRPAVIVGGAFLLGLAVGRFVKSAQPAETSASSSSSRGNRNRNGRSSRRPRSA
jgi:hypothetical protein